MGVVMLRGLFFTRCIKSISDLVPLDSHLLSVGSRLVLPVNTSVRFCVTFLNVFHRWSFSFAGINVGAVPGLLNCVVVNFPVIGILLWSM
jgi:heme/copper-type cytochrome/quinol oxidase subunit 2